MSVTIKQIAEEAQISWPAVSQILKERGRFSAATRERVLAVAKKHGYRPNASARALRQQQTKMIGVIFRNAPDQPTTNMAAFEYLLGINQQFQIAEYDTVLIRAGELLDGKSPEPRVFRERLVDGTIVVGAFPKPLIQRVESLSTNNIWLDGPVWRETCCLRRDEVRAGRMAVEALINLGYRKITFLSRPPKISNHHSLFEREAGARAAAEAVGVKFEIVSWPECDLAGELEMVAHLARTDTGFVAGSMPTARRVVNRTAMAGYQTGRDFGLVCCDDVMDNHAAPDLCRVGFSRFAMGELAATMMLGLLASPENPPISRLIEDQWKVGSTAWGPS